MTPEFTAAKDGDNEPTLWRVDGERWVPILRRCDLPAGQRDVWPLIVAGVVGGGSL